LVADFADFVETGEEVTEAKVAEVIISLVELKVKIFKAIFDHF